MSRLKTSKLLTFSCQKVFYFHWLNLKPSFNRVCDESFHLATDIFTTVGSELAIDAKPYSTAIQADCRCLRISKELFSQRKTWKPWKKKNCKRKFISDLTLSIRKTEPEWNDPLLRAVRGKRAKPFTRGKIGRITAIFKSVFMFTISFYFSHTRKIIHSYLKLNVNKPAGCSCWFTDSRQNSEINNFDLPKTFAINSKTKSNF